MNRPQGGAVIGYYSFKDERIRIRGTQLDPAVKSTLVHELTHALQDQHFNVGKHEEAFDKDDESSSSESAYDALVEGDAERVETAYRESLTPKQRTALDRARAKAASRSGKKTADVPKIFKTMLGAPYALGEAMLALAVDPWTLIEDHEDAAKVDAPKLEKGEKEFGSGDFGALGWYIVLAERLPLVDALDAVDGWGGDAYAAFERDDVSCVRVNYRGDSERDLTEMHGALRAWVNAGPDGSASVRLDGNLLTFEACDPGTTTGSGRDASQDALELALTRTYAALNIIKGGAPEELGRCVADRLVHDFPWRDLSNPNFGADAAAQARIRRIAASCH